MKQLWIAAIVLISVLGAVGGSVIGLYWGNFQPRSGVQPEKMSPGVVINQDGLEEPHADLKQALTEGAAGMMKQDGLAGVTGGAHFKLTANSPQEVILPIPQLVDGQVPLCYFIRCTPAESVDEYRLRQRDDENMVVHVRFEGGRREVQLDWSSVVLFVSSAVTPNTTVPEPYRAATSSAQAEAAEIVKLAAETWPASGNAAEFAAQIQRYVQQSQRKEQPRSLDALGILRSGENSICTANANLAAALMRAKGIACRSMAVVPPISQRLEMHRVVEFFDDNRWVTFDPSSLQTDIPAQPWQNVIMAKTTVWDEKMAATPRMGAMLGCPYGQEVELLSSGITLWGQDFFWSMAKPLAEFEPDEESVRMATESWQRYLETGRLTQAQIKAASAKTAAELAKIFQTN